VHVCAAVDGLGTLLGVESFATTTTGYRQLVAWAARRGLPDRSQPGCLLAQTASWEPKGVEGLNTPNGRYFRPLTALAITSTETMSADMHCTLMRSFARVESGIVSVGLNAVELVTETYR
jgi:hypothetical protein